MSCSEHETKKYCCSSRSCRLVVRVEHLGDGLRRHLLVNRPVVVAVVEGLEVERLRGLCAPEAQQVGVRRTIAGDRSVVGHAGHHVPRDPPHAVPPPLVLPVLGAPAEFHVDRDLGPDDLPRVAEAQPLVGQLHLPAVADALIEDAELIADAVADGRHAQCRQRVHVAGGEPPEAAVAQPGLLLLRDQGGEVLSEQRHGGVDGRPQSEIDQGVAQVRAQ
jgi:hypothetical protein